MTKPCTKHEGHAHVHSNFGHAGVHDGHLHDVHGNHVDEHKLEAGKANEDRCTPDHHCGAHQPDQVHWPDCGHQAVPYGNHVDYLVKGHLHHPHGTHCDDHGRLEAAA